MWPRIYIIPALEFSFGPILASSTSVVHACKRGDITIGEGGEKTLFELGLVPLMSQFCRRTWKGGGLNGSGQG
jgi:hypothetical protein